MNQILLGSAEPHAEHLRSDYRLAGRDSLGASVAEMRSCTGSEVLRRQGTALPAATAFRAMALRSPGLQAIARQGIARQGTALTTKAIATT